MITLSEMCTALGRAAEGAMVVAELAHPPPFCAGYVVALADLRMFLDDTGILWQRLVPTAMLPSDATLQARFATCYGAALRGGDP